MSRSGLFYPDPNLSPLIFGKSWYWVPIRYLALTFFFFYNIFLDKTAALEKKVPASKLFLNRFFLYFVETKYTLSYSSFLFFLFLIQHCPTTFLALTGESVTLHCDSRPSCTASWSVCKTEPTLGTSISSLFFSYSLKGPILYCFLSISHSCQRSKNSLFNMHCPKPMRGPDFQLSKSRSTEFYSDQSVSVPAPLNANELRLSTPTWRALPASHFLGEYSPCVSGSMC